MLIHVLAVKMGPSVYTAYKAKPWENLTDLCNSTQRLMKLKSSARSLV